MALSKTTCTSVVQTHVSHRAGGHVFLHQTTATQRCLFIDYFKTWMDSLVAIIRVVKWRCGKKRVPRLWLQTRWHLPHINASFSEALLYRDVSFTPSFFISKCFAFWWCRGFVTLFLSCCWFFLSVHIPEHPVCLSSCVWWEQMQVPVVLLWLLTPPLLFLGNVLPFFRKEGRLLLFKEGYSDFFVIPVTAHRLLDSAQKKREREREGKRDGGRGRRTEESKWSRSHLQHLPLDRTVPMAPKY